MECSQAYRYVYEQNEQMVSEMHGLATTNISLRQELERACKTIESSHTQNVELEALPDGMAKEVNETGSVAEADCRDTTEAIEARIVALKKRLTMEEDHVSLRNFVFGSALVLSISEIVLKFEACRLFAYLVIYQCCTPVRTSCSGSMICVAPGEGHGLAEDRKIRIRRKSILRTHRQPHISSRKRSPEWCLQTNIS